MYKKGQSASAEPVPSLADGHDHDRPARHSAVSMVVKLFVKHTGVGAGNTTK